MNRMELVTELKKFPTTAHYAIVEFSSCYQHDPYEPENPYRAIATHYYFTLDETIWKNRIIENTNSKQEFKAFYVPSIAKTTVTVDYKIAP